MTELIPIDAGFATIGQGAGPMMVTWKAGLFHKHGLAVERPRIMGGAKGVDWCREKFSLAISQRLPP